MIDTINISLPSQLKKQADSLVSDGHFVSFSDLVRTAIRTLLNESKYDIWAKEAIKEYKNGKANVMKDDKEIDAYLNTLQK